MATINIRQKGANGERELCTNFNAIINMVRTRMGLERLDSPQVQRNQNQTAVGGQDLIGTYEYCIEVKRQEQLAINTWWAQTEKSAQKLGQEPVLIYRKNHQKWAVVMYMMVPMGGSNVRVRGEMSMDDFEFVFAKRVEQELLRTPIERRETLFAQ